ncbi:SagB/ThcOx family dehydrogenase [Streptococcus gallolyticus]|uniref:SagB/ThcOx family dehydrogenase n=1 Tax=Streptococcus gallolyticus TaxID=315405 RepID=UPI0022849847|nr:SagB/ThcOx family dehydrogenase [Streptococcus gallolyticus]MCY7192188.1 SagB/ThcOx family dehydrogenase [Streptococcus gallolyticus subsp. gallolyticus]
MENFKFTMISNHYAQKISQNNKLLQLFHQNTKHSKKYLLRNMFQSRVLLNNPNFLKTSSFVEKQYPLFPKITLKKRTDDILMRSLYYRRSQVKIPIKSSALTEKIVSDLFWAGYGVNFKGTRVTPSGGALYPLELYGLILEDCGKIKRGLYHYRPSLNAIELISDDEEVFDIGSYIMMLQNLENPSVIFFTTAIFNRMTFKYDARAYRYLLLEAGAMAQNISLVATKYNLVSTFIGGTDDFKVEKVLGIDGVNESLVNCLFITKDGSWGTW